MPRKSSRIAVALAALALAAIALAAAELGSIEGVARTPSGAVLSGVWVTIEGVGGERLTDDQGRFAFSDLPPGAHTLVFSLDGHPDSTLEVQVAAGTPTEVEWISGWALTFADTVTVTSASRHRERVVEAPAAITALTAGQIERAAAAGQLPRLLEFTPGAELGQGGLYDFNFNVRGMNDVLNRRVLTLIDGRDASVPSLGHEEWAAIGFPLDDLASAELVRGPGSALYGADAFNGVLNLTTHAPSAVQGGRLRLTAGELDTRKIDLRWATALGGDWYLKLLGGYTESEDFSRSRTTGVEYSTPCGSPFERYCLPLESTTRLLEDDEVRYVSLRLDRDLGETRTLAIEGGTGSFEGPLAVTEFGRMQLLDVERPWARVNLNSRHWNLLGTFTGRRGDRQVFLNGGYFFYTDSDRFHLEAQGNSTFAGGRGFAVGGASATWESIDSAGPDGRQTVTFRPRDEEFEALFGQIEYNLSDRLKGVLAVRWDNTSLHDSQISPRGSLVWAVAPDHTLRLSASHAFLTPNYAQLFLYLPAATPVDLRPLEEICAIAGVSCGFDQPLAFRVIGNQDLDPEEVESLELGYSGVIGHRTFVTVDAYASRNDDFISDYIPYLNPSFGGRLHDGYAPWAPPPELPAPLAALLVGTLGQVLPPELAATLSTGAYGEPFFPLFSVVNFGRVDTRGVEIGVDRALGNGFSLDAGYAWFDFDVRRDLPEDPALGNSADHRAQAGLTYRDEKLGAAVKYRYSTAFDWSAGLYRGRVPAYGILDLAADHELAPGWRIGLEVANALDRSHHQFFGGDLLQRRALVFLLRDW